MKIFHAVTVEKKVLIELREDNDKALAHVVLDPETTRTLADTLNKLADIADDAGRTS